MRKHYSYLFMSLIIAFLQLIAAYLTSIISRNIDQLHFGLSNGALSVISICFSLASGYVFCKMFMMVIGTHKISELSIHSILSLGLIPALGAIFKIAISTLGIGVIPFSLLNLVGQSIFHWSLYSQIPGFWLGLVLCYVMLSYRPIHVELE